MARGTHAPRTESRVRGAGDLVLVFGVMAFAIGPIVTAMGVSDPLSQALPLASWDTPGVGAVARRDVPLVRMTAAVALPSPHTSPPDAIRLEPPQLDKEVIDRPTMQWCQAAAAEGHRDRHIEFKRAASLARHGEIGFGPPPPCTPTSCQSGGRTPGD